MHPCCYKRGPGEMWRSVCSVQEQARRLLWHTVAMVRIQRAHGHFSHLENLYGSRAFKQPFMQLALKRAGMCCAKVHQCMTNLRGARGGGLLRKESAIWTDSPVMHSVMNRLRRDTQSGRTIKAYNTPNTQNTGRYQGATGATITRWCKARTRSSRRTTQSSLRRRSGISRCCADTFVYIAVWAVCQIWQMSTRRLSPLA